MDGNDDLEFVLNWRANAILRCAMIFSQPLPKISDKSIDNVDAIRCLKTTTYTTHTCFSCYDSPGHDRPTPVA